MSEQTVQQPVTGTIVELDVADVDDSGGDDQATPEQPRRSALAAVTEWVLVVVVAISSALLVNALVCKQYAVSGPSMESTLFTGDRVLVNRLSYRLHDPNRGDVVVLHELSGTKDLIKRVIALPGETIDIRDCQVFIDGKRLIEPYLDPIKAACTTPNGVPMPYTVPPESVFVIGDNRGSSSDSRAFGAVSYDELVGRAFVVIWPFADRQWL